MLIATLKLNLAHSGIDADKGILTGVKVMQLGKLAQFAGPKGEVKKVKIIKAHIDALLNHAGNRALPMHLTHDWFDSKGKPDADTVEMKARIGALKAFRKDESGDLIADAYLKEGDVRKDICWGAEHNPENNMLSAVFGYSETDPQCLPQNFQAVDLVPTGAAVTALFSETQPSKNMTPEEFIALLADANVKAAFLAMLPAPVTPLDETALLAKLDIPGQIATAVKAVKVEMTPEERTALLKEAEAAVVKNIGTNPGLRDFHRGGNTDSMPFVARLSAHEKICANRATAILRAKNDAPEEYNAWEAAGRPMPTATA